MKMRTLHLVVGEPDASVTYECLRCGFDAALDFPLTAISDEGVEPFGTFRACCRCWDEGKR